MTLDHTAVLQAETQQPVIAADRFVLRPLRQSDAGLIALHAGDRRVAEMTRDIPHPLPPGAAEALIRKATSGETGEVIWALDGSASGHAEVIGLIALEPMGRRQSEITYWVAPAFWNSGIATEAVETLMAANPLGDGTTYAEVFQDNPGSARVLTNAGFDYLGDAEAYSVARGAMVPTWTYVRRM